MTYRLRRALISVLLLAVTVLGFGSAAAAAAPSRIDPGDAAVSMCDASRNADALMSAYAAEYLPVIRWGDTVPMHTRLAYDDLAEKAQRNGVIKTSLSAGNMGWQFGSWSTMTATRFCIGDNITRTLDRATAQVGTALTSSGLLLGAVILVAMSVIWRARGSGQMLPVLGRMGLTLAVFAVLITGAARTTDTSFGKGSPGWWSNAINTTVSVVAAQPANALNAAAEKAVPALQLSGAASQTDCRNYIAALRNEYQSAFGFGAGGSSNVAVASATMDSMWVSSGYATWARVQFGDNDYASKVACRMLEGESGRSATASGNFLGQVEMSQLMPRGSSNVSAPIPGLNPASLAFSWTPGTDEADMAMVGWAACDVRGGQVSVAGKWASAQTESADRFSVSHCQSFFQADKKVLLAQNSNPFDFEEDQGDTLSWASKAPAEANFILNLHGYDNSTAIGTSIMFMVGGGISGITFGRLALAVLVAKTALVALVLFAIWVLIGGLLKPHEDGSAVVKLGKQFIVVAVFAFGSSLMLAMFALIANTVSAIGVGATAPGSFGSVAWVALAPLITAVLFHQFFTKILRAPSPFKPSSALAWGAAAAGTGMLAGAGLQRAFDRRTGAARRIGERAVANRLGYGGGGGGRRGGRLGGMLPTAAAAAGGAMAGSVLADKINGDGADGEERAPTLEEARAYKRRGNRELPEGATKTDDLKLHTEAAVTTLRNLPVSAKARIAAVPARTKERVAAAALSVMEHPGRTALKAAGAATAALALPGVGAAAVGAMYAVHKVRARRGQPSRRSQRDQAVLNDYARVLSKRREAAAEQAAAAAQAQADEEWLNSLPPEDHVLAEREHSGWFDVHTGPPVVIR